MQDDFSKANEDHIDKKQTKNPKDYRIMSFIRRDQAIGYNQVDYYDEHFENIMLSFEKEYQKSYPIHNFLEQRIMDDFLTGAAHTTAQCLADYAMEQGKGDAIPIELDSTIKHVYFGRGIIVEQNTWWHDGDEPKLSCPSLS